MTITVKNCKLIKMKNIKRYNITYLAKELGVTRQTIYYWIKKRWIMPKRDYRNYPVFSDKDLGCIKRWYSDLKNVEPAIEQGSKIKNHGDAPSTSSALTWKDLQKMLYK